MIKYKIIYISITEKNNFFKQGKYDDALLEFKKSVELDNKFWQGYQAIGNCYFAKDEITNAKKAFEKSLMINPDNEKLREFLKGRFGYF